MLMLSISAVEIATAISPYLLLTTLQRAVLPAGETQ
jgi:hypothetical protein